MEKKFQILVIDDEEDLRENLKYILVSKGYEVQLAEDGVKGLKKLESYKPDLIILDMNMPNMGGIEFYQRICVGDEPKYPVFVLTARANMEQLFKELKVEGFMTKPFEIEEFVHEVELIVKKHKGVADQPKQPTMKDLFLKNVFLIEDDPEQGGALSVALLDAGYRVVWVKSGPLALELMTIDPPLLAAVKLGLSNIAGDVVIQRAMKMAKTASVKLLLYQKTDLLQLDSIQLQLKRKMGQINLVECGEPVDLISAVEAEIGPGF